MNKAVVFAISTGFEMHLSVALESLYFNNLNLNFTTYVLFPFGKDIIKGNLIKLAKKYNRQIIFLSVKEDCFKGFPKFWNGDYTTYFRLKIPELLDKQIDTCLYLDSDIVVDSDISELFNFDFGGNLLACCEDYLPVRKESMTYLKIPLPYSYFNAGVILLNLKRLRKNNLFLKVIRYIQTNPLIKRHDQDGLNAVLYSKWFKLDRIYNFIDVYVPFLGEKPKIIHYTGYKPDSYFCRHPFRDKYWFYLKRTPYSNFKIKDFSFINFFKKHFLFNLRFIKRTLMEWIHLKRGFI